MDDTEQRELPSGLASGRLEGVSVPDLLWAICRRRLTGVLRFGREQVRKTIYIQDGQIVFASSAHPDDRLGEQLLREGSITIEQLEEALGRLDSGKRLGTLLVEAGHLGADKLVAGVLSQVQRIVLETFTWEDGAYEFEEGDLPTQEVITLGMKTGEILQLGIRRIRSFGRIRRSVGPPRTFYRLAPEWRDAVGDLALSDGEEMLLSRLENEGETVEQLCKEVFLSNFEIYQTLWAMKVLGVIQEGERPINTRAGASAEGLVGRLGIAGVLVDLCRAGETGVLHVIRGSQERTVHVKEGGCVFATSNDFEDGLLAHLLRRGVISLQDREETAKRLLSNKRVGTILREMGVIDEQDLRMMVREQLSEIIYDTLCWDSGEYTFVSGELPTIEEITLECSLETLVAGGLRRIASWSRVRQGCGGLGARLQLSPDYLEVLDRMSVSEREWDVITRLKEPRTVADVCRDADVGDFAACQTLWVLRVLGAVEEAPATADDAVSLAASGVPPADSAEGEPAAVLAEPDERGPDAAGEVPASGGAWADDREQPLGDSNLYISRDYVATALAGPDREPLASPDSYPPPLDSPGDATTYIPREEVEAALRGPDSGDSAEFELTDPATTVEETDGEVVDRIGIAETTSNEGEATADIPGDALRAALQPEDEETGLEPVEGFDRWGVDAESSGAAPDPDWQPPDDLEEQIARFNARQRVLYRTIRAEVGAGAANFVRSCTVRLGAGYEQALSAAELRPDGSWDAEALRQVAQRLQIADPGADYELLIETEIEMLRAHIGESRAAALRRKIDAAGAAAAPEAR